MLFSQAAFAVQDNNIPNNFINNFLIYLGGGNAFRSGDAIPLAKFDMIVVDRFRYKNIQNNTWKVLKSRNKKLNILLYQNGPQVSDNTDNLDSYYLNNISRLNKAKSKIETTVGSHEDWFLTNKAGLKLRSTINANSLELDFGNEEFQNYWVNATYNDVIDTAWKADGIFIDNCSTFKPDKTKDLLLLRPEKYSSADTWDKALNQFVSNVTSKLNKYNQLVMANRTNSRIPEGEKAWVNLDSENNPPQFVLEEGAFVVSWGPGDVQFFSEEDWWRQINLPAKLNNSSVAYLSHTDLALNSKGVDSDGNAVNFKQVFDYSLGSYLLAKRTTQPYTLFGFDYDRAKGDYKRISWFNIYDKFNLGLAVDDAKLVSENVYSREFEQGFVFVNPSKNNRQITYDKKYKTLINIDTTGTVKYTAIQNNASISIGNKSAVFISK